MSLNIKRIFKIIFIIGIVFIIFLFSIVYFGFLDWKKTLITKMSSESTMFIGQAVKIDNLSISLFKGVTIYDISVKNPEDFDSGELLYIRKLFLGIKLGDLVRGRFHFNNITVYSPELTVVRDENGNLNISEKLKNFFKRKPKIKYHIDEFKIVSGVFVFNNDKRYRNDNINLSLQSLSSQPGTKTLIKGRMSYAGVSALDIKGWAYLKDEPQTFHIAVSSSDFTPIAVKEIFERYRINTEKMKIGLNINADGSSDRGVTFTSKIHMTRARFDFLNREIKDVLIDTDGMFNMPDASIHINNLSFSADDVLRVRSNAVITNIWKSPAYHVTLKIGRIDLAAFNLMPDIKMNGITSSQAIQVKGEFKKKDVILSGVVDCVNFAFTSTNTDSETESAHFKPSSDKKMLIESKVRGQFFTEKKIPYNILAKNITISLQGIRNASGYHGNVVADAKGVSVLQPSSKRNILKDVFLHSDIQLKGDDLLVKANIVTGKISARLSGAVKRFREKDRYMNMQASVPEVKVTDIRNSFWDVFPDSLLYTGLNGYISSNISIDYDNSRLKVTGYATLKDFMLEGENMEYSVGPVNGTLPLAYTRDNKEQKAVQFPSFDRSNFEDLDKYFSKLTSNQDYKRITIGSLSYGFKLFENIILWVDQAGSVLNIRRFNSNIFGGELNGSAVVDISDGFHYKAGIILKGLSLTNLCNSIDPIRGYISGKVNGIAYLKGSGTGIPQLAGKADFWTYSIEDEKTKISKEFLKKIGGASLKAYLGDRRFDKGIMSLYVKDGFIIFSELEISNRNFLGITDLSIKVAPFNNKVAIDHLMWTIIEAAHRAKEK